MNGRALNLRNVLRPAAPILVATISALVGSAGLAILAAPPDFDERMDALEMRKREVQRSFTRLGAAPADADRVLCRQTTAQLSQELRAALTTHATQAGLSLSGVEIGPDGSVLGETLVPVRVRFEVEGAYDGVIGSLDLLGQLRPSIFVDTVDLTSKSTGVTLSLTGRVFCVAPS